MPTSTAQLPLPADLETAYTELIAMSRERNWKIVTSDDTQHNCKLKIPGSTLLFNIAITALPGSQSLCAVWAGDFTAADYSEGLKAAIIEPLLARLDDKLRKEAEALLQGESRDEVLRSNQPLDDQTAGWLQEALSGLSAYSRRDAVRALGALAEPNQRVAAGLVQARETDAHDTVRSAAREVLQMPAYQALLSADPAWAQQVLALTRIRQAGVRAEEQQTRVNNRSAESTIAGGYLFTMAGVVGLILPVFGYQLIFRGLPTGQPLVAGLVLFAGAVLLFLGYKSKK